MENHSLSKKVLAGDFYEKNDGITCLYARHMLYYFMVLIHTHVDLNKWCCNLQFLFKDEAGGGKRNHRRKKTCQLFQ
jgi:hypothetical protein